MGITIELNAQAKTYEAKAPGMFAWCEAAPQHEAWIAMTALTEAVLP